MQKQGGGIHIGPVKPRLCVGPRAVGSKHICNGVHSSPVLGALNLSVTLQRVRVKRSLHDYKDFSWHRFFFVRVERKYFRGERGLACGRG